MYSVMIFELKLMTIHLIFKVKAIQNANIANIVSYEKTGVNR